MVSAGQTTPSVAPLPTAPPSRPNRRPASRRSDARLAWALVAPAIAGFLVFAAYPTVRGIYLSFTDFRVLSPPEWVGVENYVRLAQDDVFWRSLSTTVWFVVLTVVLTMLVSVGTAVVLHRLTRSTVMRGLIILPFLVSNVVAGVVWSWMLDSQLGIVNIALDAVTGATVRFLSDPAWVVLSLALITVWKGIGYTAILVFAGLQTIPGQIYEAGRMDGASEWRMFRSLTLPLLRPIIALVLVLTVIGAFQVFDIVSVTTKGGPANASNVLQMYIYNKAFGQFDFGYASAMSLALFAILLVISFVQMRVLRAGHSDIA